MQTEEPTTQRSEADITKDLFSNYRSKSLMGVQIELTVSVGKTRLALSELVKLEKDSVLQLDSRIEDTVYIYVGDRLIARGELEEIDGTDGQLGVRLTDVADLSDGV